MRKIISLVAIVLVIATVIAGFFLAGSPQTARIKQADERRVSDLQQIGYALDSHYQSQKSLPDTLAGLNVDVKFLPTDPITSAPYEYRKTNDTQYELCATFDTEAEKPRPGEYFGIDQSYNIRFHSAGYNCFTLSAPTVK